MTIQLTVVALGAAIVGLAVAAALLAVGRSPNHTAGSDGPDRAAVRLRLWHLAAALVSAAAVFCVGTVLVVRVFDMFALVHAAYLGLVVTTPLIAAGCLLLGRRRGTARTARIAAIALLLLAPLGIYMTHVEPAWLRVDTIDVALDADRVGSGSIRVGVLSDLQTAGVGEHERRAVRELKAARPDVIVLPGDIFQGDDLAFDAELPELRELLGELDAPGGVFLVQGDVDRGNRSERLTDGTDIVLLSDETRRVDVADRQLLVGGTRLDVTSAGADRVRAELLAEPIDGAVTLLVSHRPDTVLHLPVRSRVDLTVAGHTHGGQIVVPGVGPLMTLTDVPRAVARGGLHEVGSNQIYVAPGVGLERGHAPQMRLFNRPAIALLDISPSRSIGG